MSTERTRDEITTILRLKRAGIPAAEICATHNISENTLLRLQQLYGTGLSTFTRQRQIRKPTGPLLNNLLNRNKS